VGAEARFSGDVQSDSNKKCWSRRASPSPCITYDCDPPADLLKTLMALVDGKGVAPPDREVSMKRRAAAFGAQSARMMKPADAEWRHQPVRPDANVKHRDGDGT